MDTNQNQNQTLIAFADQERERLEGVGLSDALVQIFNEILKRKDKQMGYFKNLKIDQMEMEKMENDKFEPRDQEPTRSDDEMRLMARKFLVAVCEARLSGHEPIKDRMADDFVREKVFERFNQFSEEDWEEFKRFVQFAL
tara:strand:+ start:7796 stop:8215 length:420 start_codon:yes stop_codon:yes gene_type:complete